MAGESKSVICPEVLIQHDEKNEGLVGGVEIPGVDKSGIELTMSSNGFCISAEREDLKYEGCYQFSHEVNRDKARAKYENGLLTFWVPFKESLQGSRINIE